MSGQIEFKKFWHQLESRIPEANIALGLERMNDALDRLGRPERQFQVILVAGTNGKGSTCRFTEQLLLKRGCAVGCFSSPHLRAESYSYPLFHTYF